MEDFVFHLGRNTTKRKFFCVYLDFSLIVWQNLERFFTIVNLLPESAC